MEFLGATIVFFASLFASLQRNTLSAGLVGLSVSYSQQVRNTGRIYEHMLNGAFNQIWEARLPENFCIIELVLNR